MLDSTEEGFEVTISNTFKELKEIRIKDVKEYMMTMIPQIMSIKRNYSELF